MSQVRRFLVLAVIGTVGGLLANTPAHAARTQTVRCAGTGDTCAATVSIAGGAKGRIVTVKLTDTDLTLRHVSAIRAVAKRPFTISKGSYRLGGSVYRFTLDAAKRNPKRARIVLVFSAGRSASGGLGATVPLSTQSPAATQASFDKLARSIDGTIGVSYGPPGIAQPVTSFGPLKIDVAWSTSKLFVGTAAVRQDGGTPSPATAALLRPAITESSNDAAKALWASLGTPAEAGVKSQAVLADAGDAATQVQTEFVRPGFTAFGQTQWSLVRAAQFAGALQCLRGAETIYQLMAQVIPDQSWGLGTAGTNQHFKGGWGPDENGKYLVRQLGQIDVASGGTVAVAIATKPNDGTFESGQTQLTKIAQWVAAHAKGGTPVC